MGITQTTKAANVQFNVSMSDEDFKLPDFPVKTMEENKQQDNGNAPSQMTPEQMQQMQDMMKNFTQR